MTTTTTHSGPLPPPSPGVALLAALPVFFVSGFSALLYQVVWQRLLVVFAGTDLRSVTVIVTAFMAGLGFGALAGGRLADRIRPRASLWAFAATELLIGLFASVSKPIYYDWLQAIFPQLAATPAAAAAILVVCLLPPTFLMGASLPLLARALTTHLGASGRVIGSLYGWNTLGAASGAFIGTWGLMPRLGLEGTLQVGAALNIACAAAAAAIATRSGTPRDPEPQRVDGPDVAVTVSPAGGPSFAWWTLLFGFTGFLALALEIVWFRVLGVALKSTAFTFGTLLGVYLTGLGLGAAIAARLVGRSRRPGEAFLAMQYGLTLYVACSIIALVAVLGSGHPVKLVRYLGGNEPADIHGTLAALAIAGPTDGAALQPLLELMVLYIVVPVALIGPPTLLMGLSFPFLQKATHVDFANLGRRLGTLMAANITGSVLGAASTGWLLVPLLGTGGALRVLVALGIVLVLAASRVRWSPGAPRVAGRPVWATALVVTGVVVAAMPTSKTLWARLHSAGPEQVIFAEDGAGLSLLKAETPGFQGDVTFFVNGLSQSWIPYGQVHTVLGALPALIHPEPAEVAIIGLGSGDTVFAVAARPEVQRVVCVELIGSQRDTLRQLAHRRLYAGLHTILGDPRIDLRVGDGRAFIAQHGRRFDIIEADALRPSSAYSGNLYSREYFSLLRRHLAAGGLAVTWAPTARIRRTFVSVFPYVLEFADISIGSDQPIPFDRQAVAARALQVRDYFRAAGVDIERLLEPYLSAVQDIGPDDARRASTDVNTDIFPKDEFSLPF